jgi:octaprenyl-diphosphate synthase
MTLTLVAEPSLIHRLRSIVGARDLGHLDERLRRLDVLAAEDLAAVERAIAALPREGALALRSAGHLLDLGGKRLRPLCVALASRLGTGFGDAARSLAIAVEMVHSATLLHDDVVDYGELRRGAPTARALFGNAASIFAGDWLLIEALGLVRAAGIGDTLERLLGVVRDMILGESRQLELRGRVCPDRSAYLSIVEGKTASLFSWAAYAGGCAGGLAPTSTLALERYGRNMGMAFQIVDDLLDFTGDAEKLGKNPFADLREGKTTYPLLLALEKEPALRERLDQALRDGDPPDAQLRSEITLALHRSGALEESRRFAERFVAEALEALATLPAGPARDALETVAQAAITRDH